jgi:hypothetical protein
MEKRGTWGRERGGGVVVGASAKQEEARRDGEKDGRKPRGMGAHGGGPACARSSILIGSRIVVRFCLPPASMLALRDALRGRDATCP